MIKKQYLAMVLAILGLLCLTVGLINVIKEEMINYGLIITGSCFTVIGLFLLSFKKFVISTGSPTGLPTGMNMGTSTASPIPPSNYMGTSSIGYPPVHAPVAY